jgi:hypothetical protein
LERTWRDAIIRVLREAQRPLEYAEISERILTEGYYKTDGATPRATVNAQITGSIKHDGPASPFIKVGRGVFGLKEVTSPIDAGVQPQPVVTSSTPAIAVTEAEVGFRFNHSLVRHVLAKGFGCLAR